MPFMRQRHNSQQTLCAVSVKEGSILGDKAGILTIPCTESTRIKSSRNLSGLLRRYRGRHCLRLYFRRHWGRNRGLTASGDIAVVDNAGRHAEVFDAGR